MNIRITLGTQKKICSVSDIVQHWTKERCHIAFHLLSQTMLCLRRLVAGLRQQQPLFESSRQYMRDLGGQRSGRTVFLPTTQALPCLYHSKNAVYSCLYSCCPHHKDKRAKAGNLGIKAVVSRKSGALKRKVSKFSISLFCSEDSVHRRHQDSSCSPQNPELYGADDCKDNERYWNRK